jgi:hypothetical protein
MKASLLAFALRRAWARPLRTAVAIAACTLAWFSLLGALFETQALARQAEHARLLGGKPGYQLEMQSAYQSNGVLVAATIPPELLDIVRERSAVHVRQLDGLQPVLREDRAQAIKMTMLFYDDALAAASPGERTTFPACSVLQAPEELARSSFLTFVKSTWRCDLRPLPAALDFLRYNRSQPALALPMSAMNETVGMSAGRRTQTVWFGAAGGDAAERIGAWAGAHPASPLALTGIGQALSEESMSLSQVTMGWVIGSLIMLACGVGLYVQGTHREMKRELSLRLCVGTPLGATTAWFALDVGMQVFNAIGIAFVMALILRAPIGVSSFGAIVQLFGAAVAGLIALIVLMSMVVVARAGGGRYLARGVMA